MVEDKKLNVEISVHCESEMVAQKVRHAVTASLMKSSMY